MNSWLVLVHGHEQSQCSTASSETWEFKQGENTASPFSLFSLPGHTPTSVLQLSLMGDLLLRKQRTPSPRNTSPVGAVPPSFSLAQTAAILLCLTELHWCGDGHGEPLDSTCTAVFLRRRCFLVGRQSLLLYSALNPESAFPNNISLNSLVSSEGAFSLFKQ